MYKRMTRTVMCHITAFQSMTDHLYARGYQHYDRAEKFLPLNNVEVIPAEQSIIHIRL
jgi:hypothetical protein